MVDLKNKNSFGFLSVGHTLTVRTKILMSFDVFSISGGGSEALLDMISSHHVE